MMGRVVGCRKGIGVEMPDGRARPFGGMAAGRRLVVSEDLEIERHGLVEVLKEADAAG